MKSNRGITLTSLIIYVIGLLIIIALMSNFLGYFNQNLSEISIKQNAEEQYSKFLSYITKDANSNKLAYVKSGADEKDCIIFVFSDNTEHQYICQNKNIYFVNVGDQIEKKITLCENISASTSTGNVFNYTDKKLYINFKINDSNFSTILNVKM